MKISRNLIIYWQVIVKCVSYVKNLRHCDKITQQNYLYSKESVGVPKLDCEWYQRVSKKIIDKSIPNHYFSPQCILKKRGCSFSCLMGKSRHFSNGKRMMLKETHYETNDVSGKREARYFPEMLLHTYTFLANNT